MSTSMPVRQPEGISYHRTPGGLLFSWRWFSWAVLFIGVWLAIWFSVLGSFYLAAIFSGSLSLFLLPSIHLLVGLYVAYIGAGKAFNTTKVTVGLDVIDVKTTPFPPFGHNSHLRASRIQQLYVVSKTSGRNKSKTYEVRALTVDHQEVRLVRQLQSTDDALFIEQEIEQFLELSDRYVPGSIPRTNESARPDFRRTPQQAPTDSVRRGGPFDPQPPELTDS